MPITPDTFHLLYCDNQCAECLFKKYFLEGVDVHDIPSRLPECACCPEEKGEALPINVGDCVLYVCSTCKYKCKGD